MSRQPSSGRKPVPDVLKVIRGTDQAGRTNPDQPEYESDGIQVPAHYDDVHREVWLDMVPKLIHAGVAKNIDVFALEHLVDRWVEWRAAQQKTAEDGPVITTKSGYIQMNPYYTISMQLGKEIRALMVEYGMTASSRQKIVVGGSDKKKQARFDKL